MPRPSLAASHRDFTVQADRLRKLAAYVPAFAADYQVLLGEMIALQSFYLFETAIESIAAKIVCGARYGDGTIPIVTNTAPTIEDALTSMRTLNRSRTKGILKWNRAAEIIENVRHVLDTSDTFCVACRNHSNRINEVRIVRNHIAHANQGTRQEFERVVQARLGAVPRRLPRPGAFVLREFTPGASLLSEYVVTLGVVVKEAAKI